MVTNQIDKMICSTPIVESGVKYYNPNPKTPTPVYQQLPRLMTSLTNSSATTPTYHKPIVLSSNINWGCHGRDHMVVGFTTTCTSVPHHSSCEFVYS
jgi:hypothetical protein